MPLPEELVAELTTAGRDTLDPQPLRALKVLCRGDRSGRALRATFAALLEALGKRHAQVRVAALQTVHELFCRSHEFRLLVTGQLPLVFRLAFGAYHARLPPPAQHAARLRRLAAECYYAWVERYSAAYQRLVYGFRYLRFVEQIDFKDAARAYRHNDPERVRRRRQIHADNKRECMRRLLVAIKADMADMYRRIVASLDALEQCFEILMPDIASMFGESNREWPRAEHAAADGAYPYEDDFEGDDDDDLDEVFAVMAANRHAINVDIDPDRVLETEETDANAAVFDAIRDHIKLCVHVYRPRVDVWLAKLGRIDCDADTDAERLLESVRGLSSRMAVAEAKCRDLGVDAFSMRHRQGGPAGNSDGGDDDNDFEDVPDMPERSQASTRRLPSAPGKRNPVFSLLGERGIVADPTYVPPSVLRDRHADRATAQYAEERAQAAKPNPVEERLRESAPVVSYGPDLMYWGQREISANTSGLEIRHRFLGSARDEPILSETARRNLQMRTVYYQEPERPVIRACRAPLRDGRLCPRRDLVRCPLHGAVVPRDEQGNPQPGYESSEPPADKGTPPATGAEPRTSSVATAEPRTSSVATAETLADLQCEDLEELVDRKFGPPARQRRAPAKPTRPRSSLASIRKPRASGADRLRQIIRRPK
ncbi:hypothetical protein LPJ61_003650 [Coemansia biformis]|uniref:UV-stimulated scaffold protein A C-terminal domain-containing protein n=1 Tax=Coemansia biformis TaxID=1286918 RepID=A0A9W7Y682_9FUNG|nr:hypothetical protein LPJ61_003650 [Coemansia biformis]